MPCQYCNGSRLQHLKNCPKIFSYQRAVAFNKSAKQSYAGKAPNILIGSYGYPHVNVGILSNEIVDKESDAPVQWGKKEYEIPRVVDLRSSLINSKKALDVKNFDDKLVEAAQDIALSKKHLDVDVMLEKKPQYALQLDPELTAHGPSVGIKKMEITSHGYVDKLVDKITSDTDLKATQGASALHAKHDVYTIAKLFSAGLLGKERKLVPTKWGITAVDDTVGKAIIHEINEYGHHDPALFAGRYLGNYFFIITLPGPFSYELFEIVTSTNEIAHDVETALGRKNYASNTQGGYYAARLSLLEYFQLSKKQGKVIVIRLITDEYYLGLGVWVVRETVKKAMHKMRSFESNNQVIDFVKKYVKIKFHYDLTSVIKQSELLRQKSLSSFLE